MLLYDLANASDRVGETASRNAKIALLADAVREASPSETAIAVAFLIGELRQGRIGLGPVAVRAAMSLDSAQSPSLTLSAVDAAFEKIATVSGSGSTRARGELLGELFRAATPPEQNFLARLIYGEIRQGALEGVLTDSVARAAGVPLPAVRRALQLAGDLPRVAHAAATGGEAALAQFGVQLFRPLQPMLAQPADDVDDAMSRLERAALDYKLDGARVQVHKQGDEVRVYSRLLNEVTVSVPELVESVRLLPAHELILDGEAIVLRDDGRPETFQRTMQRFGRKVNVDALRAELPLSTLFFDVLHVDGGPLIDQNAEQRFAALSQIVAPSAIVPRLITSDVAAAQRFMRASRAAGHEGLVAKSLDSTYDAGKRGSSWLKVKQADTLDLVVLAAEWGNGRRQGYLSNLHLGARDPESGGFVMLGKTFKGLTDAVLEWQTKELLSREIGREGHVVHVRPELVVEIAYEGIQTSQRYPGGVALRFARVKGYRSDKSASEADTIERVRMS
ncbi:MAG: ATP-dependent DNA ligase [Longimicrobiales bacterium]